MSPSTESVVATQSGKLEGVAKDGLLIFKGIPYAEPPVGPKRWQPPEPVKPWQGLHEAKGAMPVAHGRLGACHAIDVGFVFGTLDPVFTGNSHEATALSAKVQDAWLAFAHTGNPTCESLGEWPKYGEKRATMILDPDGKVVTEPFAEELRAWNSIPPEALGML